MKLRRHVSSVLFRTALASALCAAPALTVATALHAFVVAQDQGGTDLPRDQAEILRKAERLRSMMDGLAARYEREGAADKVRLLKEGLKHLDQTRLLEEAAAARQSLDSGALGEALQRQQDVIQNIEKLLAILLERPTVETLEAEAAKAEELRQSAEELARRQAELRAELRRTRESAASPAERALEQELDTLVRELRREADENLRQAGTTRPSLEGALARVQELLRDQAALEQTAAAERSGQRSAAQELAFRLGALRAMLDELSAEQSRANDLQQLGRDLDELERAVAAGDRERAQRQRDAALARARDVSKTMEEAQAGDRKTLDDAAKALGEALVPDGRIDEPRAQALLDAARDLAQRARAQAERALASAGEDQTKAAQEARAAAEAARAADAAERAGDPSQQSRNEAAARSLERSAEALEKAAAASSEGKDDRARSESAQAARHAAEAKSALEQANPDAAQRAREMAESAQRTREALQKAVEVQEASPEQTATDALEKAADALRETGDAAERALESDDPNAAQATEQGMQQSRSSLEQARDALRTALDSANAGREGSMQASGERNQALKERADAAQRAVEQAAERGELSTEQRDAAKDSLDEASQALDQARQELSEGAQARAANQQERAADATERAAEGLERNRPASEAEQQRMNQVEQRQKELEDEIARLKELLEERENQRAKQSAQQAQQSSERARDAMRDGESDRAEQEQEQTQQKLEETAKQLEKERDRYQDLRQEELLFKIGEELARFLEEQKPITTETLEIGTAIAGGATMTRPMRRNLNRLGERERELAGKLRFVHEALAQEGTLVFTHVIQVNERDLLDVAERLSGRDPDPSEYSQLLQREVEERTERLIAALESERQRRREEARRRQEQQDQQQQDQDNQFGPQRERLVPILSEAIMLKQMEEEMLARTKDLARLFAAAGGDGLTATDAAMAERLAWQHTAITALFQQLKSQLESALGGGEEAAPPKEERK